MATVTTDEKGLLIDGRRRWMVGGVIDPARIPSSHWERRLDAAVASGLNTITVPVAWSHHEPLEGQFRFTGEHDIARFIKLAGERRLLVVLRPGPFLGSGWDRGAIPAWVDPGTEEESGRPLGLRSSAPGFLAAAGAWIGALAEQVAPLQASRGGPIVLIQNEHRWFCGDSEEAEAYLGELARRLRENGLTMPLINTNNLYASAEGEIEAWNGFDDALATYRQLRAVRPQRPALAWDLELGRPPVWGQPADATPDPEQLLAAAAQALAAGAQFNLGPFAGGSRFGFSAGRLPFVRDGFVAQSASDGAPLDEAGRPTESLSWLRPLLLFASSFERLLASVDWSRAPACLAPGETGVSVIHAAGEAGNVVICLRDSGRGRRKNAAHILLLPDGRSLEVDLKDRPVAWCLVDATLERSRRLDYASASVVWHAGDAIALTAPAGSAVSLSINGSALELTAPRGKTPETTEHEGLTVALLNTEQASVAIRTSDGLLIGASSSEEPAEGWRSWTRIGTSGAVDSGSWNNARTGAKTGAGSRASLSGWSQAPTNSFIDGTSERFAVIEGPEDLTSLGVSEGYGWLRLTLRSASAKRPKMLLPESADRVHVFSNGEPVAVAGLGPGASEDPFTLPLAKGDNTITLLVDNLGRPAGGWSDLQRKGVWGHLLEVKAFKPGKPALAEGELLRPLDFRTPLTRLHGDDRTRGRRVTWSFMHRRKSPIVLRLGELPRGFQGLLIVNDEIVDAIDEGSRGVYALSSALRQGRNVVQIATLGDPEEALATIGKNANFHEGDASLSEKAEWSFARWERPEDRLFEPCAKTHDGEDLPVWRRATFSASPDGEPIAFDPRGLTKGQVFVNGRNLGRYFERDGSGKAVGGQRGMYLPGAWLNEGENTLAIFDEHGAPADKCRLGAFRKIRG